ncbi:hypothetical protein L598_000400000640 [Mesorhizobium sp. J18]|uniref:hypothetical protein n=1 Tax=Mesorhizobium sp. J18 TaxID=935263 RepID=UPI00119C57E2|nr:hypothetical protein [Mesorhizobium sp. J18]TWG93791.1 hypothetical protein L598_000400000640 [Mesorhizobium sp. J18]
MIKDYSPPPGAAEAISSDLHVPPELCEALDRFIAEREPGLTRKEALLAVLREWASEHGYLPQSQQSIQPEDLNASNDD